MRCRLNSRVFRVLALLFFVIAIAAPVFAQQVGFVQEIEGRWVLNNSAQLKPGESLPAGGTIRNPSPSQFDHITIANTRGEIFVKRECKAASDCARPIVLPRVARSGVLAAAYGAVMSLIWGEPDRYAVTGVRGEDLPEAVIKLDQGRVDLAPVFMQKERGRYYLKWQPVGTALVTTSPQTFDWAPGSSHTASVAHHKPGLYELTLMSLVRGEYKPNGGSGWVLLVDSRHYQNVKARFENMRRLTEKWGSDVSADAKQTFLRATLDSLSKDFVAPK